MAGTSEDDMTQIDQMEIESQSEVMDETLLNNDVSSTADSLHQQMLSDSESGESLFITQSVSAAVRTLKRRRAAGSESDSEDERDGRCPEDGHLQNEEGHSSHQTYCSFRKHKRRFRYESKKLAFPFLLNTHRRQYLPGRKQNRLENSVIGGFFKWIKRIQMDFLYYHPPKYLDDFLATDDFEDEEQNGDQEFTVVDPGLFAPYASLRNSQKWCSKSLLERRIQGGSNIVTHTDKENKDEVQPVSGRVDKERNVLLSTSKRSDKANATPLVKRVRKDINRKKNKKSREYISDTDEEEDVEVQPASGPFEMESDEVI